MKTQFLVLPYKLGARNKIKAQQAQACRPTSAPLGNWLRIAASDPTFSARPISPSLQPEVAR